MNNKEAREAWKKLYSDIDKDNWLFVGTINPEMVALAIKALGVCDRIKAIIDGWAVDDDEHELLERIADIIREEAENEAN